MCILNTESLDSKASYLNYINLNGFLFSAITDMNSKVVSVDLSIVETNIALIRLDTKVVSSEAFCRRLALVSMRLRSTIILI